jgi:uncharacterized protein
MLAIFARNGATNVRVFGSVARGEQIRGSDVDFVVRMDLGRSLFDLAALEADLEEVLGCPVNVVSEGGLTEDCRFSRRVREEWVPL